MILVQYVMQVPKNSKMSFSSKSTRTFFWINRYVVIVTY